MFHKMFKFEIPTFLLSIFSLLMVNVSEGVTTIASNTTPCAMSTETFLKNIFLVVFAPALATVLKRIWSDKREDRKVRKGQLLSIKSKD